MFHSRHFIKQPTTALIQTGFLQRFQGILSSAIVSRKQHTESSKLKESPASPVLGARPVITSRKIQFLPAHRPPKQAWLETLLTVEDDKLGIVDLHPEIFGTFPRIDILWDNVDWQLKYKAIDYRTVKTRAEMRGGGRKPYPQKGMGKARHGSRRAPNFKYGGAATGPRGPRSYFFMLETSKRVLGLRNALSVKFAQDNLHIVDTLNLPTEDPSYLRELVETRGWGLSLLFVDDTDFISHNIAVATDQIKEYNVMPVYGLNVYSMLKHETLIVTLSALEKIEQRLLEHMYSSQKIDKKFNRLDWS